MMALNANVVKNSDSMDVAFAEKDKQIIRLSLWLLRKKLGTHGSAKTIQAEMEVCSNDAVRNIAKIIVDNANDIRSPYQRGIIIDLSMLFLWILLHDTAYRNIAFRILDKILSVATELRVMIKPFLVSKEDIYSNVWLDGKELTDAQKKEGRIPEYGVSKVERQYVPNLHRQDIKKILNKMDKDGQK